MSSIRASALWLIAAAGLIPAAAQAQEPAKPPEPAKSTAPATAAADDPEPLDDDLLEFLGTVDAEGEDWLDYLAQTDIEKVARRATAKAAPDATEVKK